MRSLGTLDIIHITTPSTSCVYSTLLNEAFLLEPGKYFSFLPL